MRGYRKRRRMQKRRKMMRILFAFTSLLIFSLLMCTLVITISPAVILSYIYRTYNSARVLFVNTIANISASIKMEITFSHFINFLKTSLL